MHCIFGYIADGHLVRIAGRWVPKRRQDRFATGNDTMKKLEIKTLKTVAGGGGHGGGFGIGIGVSVGIGVGKSGKKC